MDEIQTLSVGDQILYIPRHLEKLNVNNPENWYYPDGLQLGFVTHINWERQRILCRYWLIQKGEILQCLAIDGHIYPELRTKSNGEWASIELIHKLENSPVPQSWVNTLMEDIAFKRNGLT